MLTIPPDRARPAPAEAAAAGLWRGDRWGRRLALAVLAIQLAGDVANVAFGVDRRAAFGLPVALALILYLSSRRIAAYFDRPREGGTS